MTVSTGPEAAAQNEADLKALAKGGRTNVFGFVLRLAARIPFLFIAGRLYGPEVLGRFAYAILIVDFLAREGAAFLMPQATTGAAELAARLTEVLMQPERLNSMATNARRLAKPDATRNVVDICLEVANG